MFYSKALLLSMYLNVCYISCNIIVDFVNLVQVNNAILFNCYDHLNIIYNHKYLSKKSKTLIFGNKEILQKVANENGYNAFILDFDCSEEILQEATHLKLFNETNHWLIITSNTTTCFRILTEQRLDINSNVYIAIKYNDFHYEIHDIYNSGLNNNGVFKDSKLGCWTLNNGFVFAENTWKYGRRLNMSGVIIKTMVVVLRHLEKESFEQFLLRDTDTHLDSMHRFNYRLLLMIKDIYNFSYDVKRVNSWGYNNDGVFDGMMGALQRNEIDIGGSPAFWRLERAQVADGTVQTWDNRAVFIFRHPKLTGSFWSLFTRPLDMKVWYCSISLNVAVIIILYYLFKYNCGMNPEDEIDANMSSAILGATAAMCQQGVEYKTKSTSVKMVIFTLFLYSLLIYQFYSASIVSSLLKEPPKTIQTLKDLTDSNLKVGIEPILYILDYFRRTKDPISLRLFKIKIKNEKVNNIMDNDRGMALVKKGGFAFLGDLPNVYKYLRENFSEKEICDLVEIALFPAQRMMVPAQIGSPFKKIFTYGFRRLQEHGLTSHETKKWLIPKPKCMKKIEDSLFAVTIQDFSTALIMLLMGMISSLVILACEVLVHKYACRWRHLLLQWGMRLRVNCRWRRQIFFLRQNN